jgi:secreted PhoX family phosphatase
MGHTSFQLSRRSFLRAGLSSAGALALGPWFFQRAFAAGPVTVGGGPYGPLQPFDTNGIALPAGFTSREIARGASPVAGSTPPYVWHNATDGQATFRTLTGGAPDGGWILVANSEMPIPGLGGVSGVEFAPDGAVERAYRVLASTTANCAGGPAPWGKWLSCEETDIGQVHECDPTRLNAGVARPALGVFAHEAVCVDPVREQLYLTEDKEDGCLYRFTPDDYPDLSSGLLEVATGPAPGVLDWTEVPNPLGGAVDPLRRQVEEAAHFDGGEGTWFDEGIVYFTTKGDGRVWTYDTTTRILEILYDEAAVGPGAPLSGVDNITVSPAGDIYVCEDGRDHDICMVTPDFHVDRFLKLDPVKHSGPAPPSPVAGNETVGIVFSPDGSRMYFGAQRSFDVGGADTGLPAGVVYEITGPFRRPATAPGAEARSLSLKAPKRRSIPKLLAKGLPIRIDTTEPVGVSATLRVHFTRKDGSKGTRMVARAQTEVAVRDLVALQLRPTRGARKLAGEDDPAVARLRVVITEPNGKQTIFRRRVRLTPAGRNAR